jgi:hypothetical protein
LTLSSELDRRQKGLLSILAKMTNLVSFREPFIEGFRMGGRRTSLGRKTLGRFLDSLGPLRFEDASDNAQRHEEILRKWFAILDLPISGETASVSQKKLDKLDSTTAAVELAWLEHGNEEAPQGGEGSSNFATSGRRVGGTVAAAAVVGLAVLPSMWGGR